MANESEKVVGMIDSVDEVTITLLQTVMDMWNSFFSHVPYMLTGVIIICLTWLVSFVVSKLGGRFLGFWHKRESLKELILRLVSILIWVLGLMLTAIVIFPGLTPTKALSGLGLVSIAVGLAFKDIFENFFAGILILWRFPIERGDFIECDDIIGKVEKVLVRMSYIRKSSGELVVVPNSFIFKNPVEIYTSQEKRRVSITLGIAYKEDLADAAKLVKTTVESCSSVIKEQPVQVYPNNFGASSMDMEVTWWTQPTPLSLRKSKAEVVVAVKSALDNAGIEIPFPQTTLHFQEPVTLKR